MMASKDKLQEIAVSVIGDNVAKSSLAKLFLIMAKESKSSRNISDSEILHEIFMFVNNDKPNISEIPDNKEYLKIVLDCNEEQIKKINNIITLINE